MAGATAAPAFAPDKPLTFANTDGPAFHGLFQTESRRGPISEAVAKLWRGGEGNAGAVKTAALGFFPKTSVSDAAPITAPPPQAELARPASADLPLPAAAEPTPAAKKTGPHEPLDLSAFMKRRRR